MSGTVVLHALVSTYTNWPQGKLSFASSRPSMFPEAKTRGTLRSWGNELTLSRGTSHFKKCFVIPSDSKLEKTAKKPFALSRLTHKFAAVSGS